MKILMLWVSAISGFIAAVLWFIATVVKADYKEVMGTDGMYEAAIIETEKSGRAINVLETAKKQTLWNKRAALATAISMLAQVLSLLSKTTMP